MSEITRRKFFDRTKNTTLALATGMGTLASTASAGSKPDVKNAVKNDGKKQFRAGAYAIDITPT